MAAIDATTSRGLGRYARRARPGRAMHLALADAEREYPGLDRESFRGGWNAERDDLHDAEPGQLR